MLAQGKKYSLFENTQESRSHTPNEWKVQFELTRDRYSPDTQAAIIRLFSELNNHKSHAREKLDYILNISEENPDRIPIEFKKFRAALDEDLYGMDSEKDLLATFMASNEHAGKRGYNILLWGSPGAVSYTHLTTIRGWNYSILILDILIKCLNCVSYLRIVLC